MQKRNNRLLTIAAEAQEWRHALHKHPQTSYEETFASGLVAQKLRDFGVDEIHTGIGITGLVGVIQGKQFGPGIGLRADMDALNITEENTFSHASTIEGKMHACGHDGHTSMLLGAAQYLAETRDFAGTVYLIFQPAEEGGAGADRMLQDGLLERFSIDSVWGLHNEPGLPIGQVNVCEGSFMASADTFYITFQGKGGHAAMPHLAQDQILAAARCVDMLQQVVSRETNPIKSAVLSVCMFEAGSAENILPTTAKITGSLRTLNNDVRHSALASIKRIAQSVAEIHQNSAIVEFPKDGYPVTVNYPAETEVAISVAKEIFGDAAVNGNATPSMAAEDFAFMLLKRPGCYINLGNGDTAQVHTPNYDFNDQALEHGIQYWISLVQRIGKI